MNISSIMMKKTSQHINNSSRGIIKNIIAAPFTSSQQFMNISSASNYHHSHNHNSITNNNINNDNNNRNNNKTKKSLFFYQQKRNYVSPLAQKKTLYNDEQFRDSRSFSMNVYNDDPNNTAYCNSIDIDSSYDLMTEDPHLSLQHQQPLIHDKLPVNPEICAQDLWEKSAYYKLDFKIDGDCITDQAIERLSSNNIGCLIVTENGNTVGIVSERDYVCRMAVLDKDIKSMKVKEIMTNRENMITARRSDSLECCMKKMICHDIRHLPIVDNSRQDVIGMLSIKDLIKELCIEKDGLLSKLDF